MTELGNDLDVGGGLNFSMEQEVLRELEIPWLGSGRVYSRFILMLPLRGKNDVKT